MHRVPYIGATAALLLLSGCATGDASLREDVGSLRAEIRTLQKENAELARKVDAMGTQIDLLKVRAAASEPASVAPPAPVRQAAVPMGSSPANAPVAHAPATAAESLVPAHLKVVRLEDTTPLPAKPKKSAAPAVPVATPIQEPSASELAALAPGKAGGGAQASLDAARAQTGLARARALELFVDTWPTHPRAVESLVDAARTRYAAGDPDGSCEDLSRAVTDHPSGGGMPDALEGLAACELRRGRAGEAQRLQARLAKEFPDSSAAKRAREHAPAAQGAAP